MLNQKNNHDRSEDLILYLYHRLGSEIVEELDTLNRLTDIIQVFKDNNIIALRQIFENFKRNESLEITIKAG